jgi:hypothetical protein
VSPKHLNTTTAPGTNVPLSPWHSTRPHRHAAEPAPSAERQQLQQPSEGGIPSPNLHASTSAPRTSIEDAVLYWISNFTSLVVGTRKRGLLRCGRCRRPPRPPLCRRRWPLQTATRSVFGGSCLTGPTARSTLVFCSAFIPVLFVCPLIVRARRCTVLGRGLSGPLSLPLLPPLPLPLRPLPLPLLPPLLLPLPPLPLPQILLFCHVTNAALPQTLLPKNQARRNANNHYHSDFVFLLPFLLIFSLTSCLDFFLSPASFSLQPSLLPS